MNVVKLLVPVGRQYVIKCPEREKETRASLMRLVSSDAVPTDNQGAKPDAISSGTSNSPNVSSGVRASLITGKKATSDLDFRVSPLDAVGLFDPRLRGRFNAQTRQLELTAEVSPLLTQLLNIPINLSIGAIMGTLASSYLVPDITPLLGLVIATFGIPIVLVLLAILFLKFAVERKLPALVDTVSAAVGLPSFQASISSVGTSWAKIVFSEQTVASTIAALLTIGAAFYMHSYAWDLWVKGDYQKSEALCRPVQTLATAVFGLNSAIAADCDYYIAECLRCQGKYKEAEQYYLKSITSLSQRLGEGNSKVVDGIFNLGRVYEGEGKNKEAEEAYAKSVRLYEKTKDVGPEGGWLARVLDRQAMFYLKDNQLGAAEKAALRATKIDAQWGETGNYKDYAEALNDLGVVYFKEGQFQKAEETLLKSLARKNATDSPISTAVTEYNLAQVYKALKEHSRVKALEDSARNTWRKFIAPQSDFANDEALYQAVLDKTKQDYETPNWDTRGEQLIAGPGRI